MGALRNPLHAMKTRWNKKSLRAFALKLRDPNSHPNSLGKLELGLALGVHRNTISNWFHGKYFPTPDTERKLDSVAASAGFDPNKVR